MDADSGKSQDNHTCGMTNALPGHTLTFAWFICQYVVFMVQVWKPSETMPFLCLNSAPFAYCGLWTRTAFVVKAESDSWSSDYELTFFKCSEEIKHIDISSDRARESSSAHNLSLMCWSHSQSTSSAGSGDSCQYIQLALLKQGVPLKMLWLPNSPCFNSLCDPPPPILPIFFRLMWFFWGGVGGGCRLRSPPWLPSLPRHLIKAWADVLSAVLQHFVNGRHNLSFFDYSCLEWN